MIVINYLIFNVNFIITETNLSKLLGNSSSLKQIHLWYNSKYK